MLCRKLANIVYIKYSLFHPLDATARGGRTTPPSATPLLLLHRRSSRTQIGQEMYKVGYKLIYSFLSQAIFTRPKLPVKLLQGTPEPNFMKIQQRFSRWCKVRGTRTPVRVYALWSGAAHLTYPSVITTLNTCPHSHDVKTVIFLYAVKKQYNGCVQLTWWTLPDDGCGCHRNMSEYRVILW